jgi:hypothetical protein
VVGVVEVVGVVDAVGVEDGVGVAEWRTVGDEYVLAGCDEYGAELADDDALGEADGTVVDDETAGPMDADAEPGDVCAAGCSS